MKQAVIKTQRSLVRDTVTIGLLLIILFLSWGGSRYATPFVNVLLSALAVLATTFLLIAYRERTAHRDADETIRRLESECDERTAPLATELARARNRHIDTLDHMLAGCQIIGFDWRYVYVNDAVVTQGRMSREELLGRTMMECYPGIDSTALFPVLRRCMEQRVSEYVENDFAHNDGTAGWFELSVQPVPEGIFIISIDITARKRAELDLRRQLDRLHSLRAIDLAILGTTDLSFTLQTILEETRARLRVSGACIRYFNADSLLLELAATSGIAPGDSAPVHIGEDIRGKAARDGRTVAIRDTRRAPEAAHLPPGVRAIFSTPLMAKGRLTGVFTVTFDEPFNADHEWIDYFETIAGQASMAIESAKMYEESQRSHLALRLAYDTTIEGWSRALDLRDKETEGHTRRVTDLTVKLARKAGLSEAEIVHVHRGALLHDIGKMGVPDHILLKPSQLTAEEWEHMRRHPTYAYELLRPIEYLRDALDIPLCHHEKWDGTGYPRALKGTQIPMAARLFAVADVWDAMRSDRPYRKGVTEEHALEFITSQSGVHFDPRAVGLFLKLHEEGHLPSYPEAVEVR